MQKINPHTVKTKYWHSLDDGRVQCDLCPRYCKLKEAQKGLCFVRENQSAQIVMTSYGRSSGFCIDPIEKKPLNHFLPGTPVLSFGTAGCNLTCKFCQNWDMSKSREMDTLAVKASPEMIAETFTYNDPVIFHEYALDVAAACHERDIKTVAVTAGYICEEPRAEFFAAMDATNIDLKAFTDTFYHKLTGAHLQPVLDTLVYVKQKTSVWLEITTLLIPGQNDSDEELSAMCEWMVQNLGPDVPLHFSAFHADWKMQNIPDTPASTLTRARNIATGKGLRYVYTGNVHDRAGSSSYCHHCGHLLIERDWYELGHWGLDERAACENCGTKLPGVYEGAAGHWGARRKAVFIGDK